MLTREEQLRTDSNSLYLKAKSSKDYQNQLSLYNAAISKLNELGEALTDTDRLLIARCQNNIGLAYSELNHSDAAIDGYKKSIKLWQNIKAPTEEHLTYVVQMYANTLNRLLDLSLKQDNDKYKPQATQFADTAIDELNILLNKPGRERTDNELLLLGKLHFTLARCGTEDQRNESDTLYAAKEILSLIKQKRNGAWEDMDMLGLCNHRLGLIHCKEGMPHAALPFFDKAIEFYSQVNTPASADNIKDLRQLIIKIRSADIEYDLKPLSKAFTC
jgi:tetratricopeptide (TPR) repeat protein